MRQISVLEHGIQNDGKTCVSEVLGALIASVPEDTELLFPAGIYYLSRPVPVIGKKNLTLRGEGAVLMTHFSPSDDPKCNNDGFWVQNCENLCFRDFTATTDAPTNCAGVVTAVDTLNRTYDVSIDPSFPVTGWEHFWGANTCDNDGSPDYVIATYDRIIRETLTDETGKERLKITGVPYTVVGDHRIRAKAPDGCDLTALKIGHKILYRYIIYGNTLFGFSGCRNVTLSHIEIERCSSMGAVIQPRCENFTFEAFNIRSPKGSAALYAANADGIHIVGLSGKLVMKDCFFDGLGDDALNIHSQAGEIASVDREKGVIRCIYRDRQMREQPLSPLWADKGDTICVYEHDTFLKKGSFVVERYENGIVSASSIEGALAPGDILANEAFFASVHLDHCECRNTRARGFLLQSKNMLIENCRVYGTSLPGIIISPDVRVWYEVGPSENVVIRDCVFEKCAFIPSGACLGAVVVKSCHDVGAEDYPAGVHKNIRMERNTFRNIGAGGIYISATDGVKLYDNFFRHCEKPGEPKTPQIVLCNCAHTETEYNCSDKADTLTVQYKNTL